MRLWSIVIDGFRVTFRNSGLHFYNYMLFKLALFERILAIKMIDLSKIDEHT